MKKTITTMMLIASLTVSVIPAFTATGNAAHKATAKSPRKIVSAVCPVMGNKIPDITKAAGKSVYKGKTYYFCCSMCKPTFDKDPAKYVKK